MNSRYLLLVGVVTIHVGKRQGNVLGYVRTIFLMLEMIPSGGHKATRPFLVTRVWRAIIRCMTCRVEYIKTETPRRHVRVLSSEFVCNLSDSIEFVVPNTFFNNHLSGLWKQAVLKNVWEWAEYTVLSQ